jgi:hypothetical protein
MGALTQVDNPAQRRGYCCLVKEIPQRIEDYGFAHFI